MNRQIVSLSILVLGLTSCAIPKISQEYDEFKKEKICKLEDFPLAFTASFISHRGVSISLLKQNSLITRVTLTTKILRNYKSFLAQPVLIFTSTYADGHTQDFSFKGENQTKMTQYEIVDYKYGVRLPFKYCSISFDILNDELKRMMNGQNISYIFEAEDEFIKGELNNNTIEALKTFIIKCL